MGDAVAPQISVTGCVKKLAVESYIVVFGKNYKNLFPCHYRLLVVSPVKSYPSFFNASYTYYEKTAEFITQRLLLM